MPNDDEAWIVPLPNREVRTNGGVQCDTLIGPCVCGAWHEKTRAKKDDDAKR